MRGDISRGIYQKIGGGRGEEGGRSGVVGSSGHSLNCPHLRNPLLARAECPGGMPDLFN